MTVLPRFVPNLTYSTCYVFVTELIKTSTMNRLEHNPLSLDLFSKNSEKVSNVNQCFRGGALPLSLLNFVSFLWFIKYEFKPYGHLGEFNQ
eukprot:snap_masked-scaffold_7-processed-gene-4.49-mRNA-1 protein AED:1.00 eAED:1.00 QI:0/0/0/0/1/1/3/0/90